MAEFVRDLVTLRLHYHLSKFQTLWRDAGKNTKTMMDGVLPDFFQICLYDLFLFPLLLPLSRHGGIKTNLSTSDLFVTSDRRVAATLKRQPSERTPQFPLLSVPAASPASNKSQHGARTAPCDTPDFLLRPSNFRHKSSQLFPRLSSYDFLIFSLAPPSGAEYKLIS